MRKESWSCVFLVLVAGTLAMPPADEGRKFASKPNNPKKVDYMSYTADKQQASSSHHQHHAGSNNGAANNSGAPPSGSSGSSGSSSSPSSSSSSSPALSKLAKPFQIQKGDSAFSWGNILSMALQFIYNILNPPSATEKNGNANFLQGGEFSWTKVISVVLKVALAGLGADPGIDKIDNGPASPLESMLAAALSMLMGSKDPGEVAVMAKQAGELINLGITLLDALKTSFSQRSLQARSMGGGDKYSEAAMASISLIKGYAQTYTTNDDVCRQKAVCLANQACVEDAPTMNPVYCKVASYFMAVGIHKRTESPFEELTEAGRRGRLLEDCQSMYLCNEI